jgi:hypothetical protein
MPNTNTCRLVWNKNYMLSEISVEVFRSGRKLVGPAETDLVSCSHIFSLSKTLECVRAIWSSSHWGPVISERKKSGYDQGQFHYTMITDAQ